MLPFVWPVPPRAGEIEWIDLPETSWEDVLRGMRDVQQANSLLATYPLLIATLDRQATWPTDRPLRVLDVATGLADIPRALVRWARSRGRAIEVVGLDLNARILRMAADGLAAFPEIRLVEGDALAMPFAPGEFDWVLCHLALHHFPLAAHVTLLQALDAAIAPGGGLILGDLERSYTNLALTVAFLAVVASPIGRHDGRLSILNALDASEVAALPDAAGVTYVRRAFFAPPVQFILTGIKPGQG